MQDRILSQQALTIDSSGIRKAFDLAAKLQNPINLSIGLPDFDTPQRAKDVARQSIESGLNRYTQTQGIAPLRERLRADLTREYGRDVGGVLVTSGVNGGLQLAIQACIDPGDEAVYLDPYFVSYHPMLTLSNGVGLRVESYPDFRFPTEKVEAIITKKTKLLLLNSPANPTGVMLSDRDLKEIVEIAKRHDLLIVADEIYEMFRYDKSDSYAQYSPLKNYEKCVIIRGFGKSHAMTGWRIGYAFGYQPMIEQMTRLQQYTYICAPAPLQHGALAALDVDMSSHITEYRAKRDLVFDLLSRKFEIVRPNGAFYVFPKVPKGMTGTELCMKAIEKNVLVIPGNVFSARDTHFRVSYANSNEQLRAGCEILNSLV